ncbi:putative uracil-DNA glycosylase [Acanthamoeba polyphaga mimivirus]|uniref:Uracil-DNA glycosylase n=1 Tax=Acanthamoeba polyphaga mimivirus Kroon TaxID=3069720 RepID=A0A0G2YA39_9VIRU|nr:putative uracil-DNA glycosylase [Acanthamoeba polyphaga mimivirus]AKI79981.1 putative uracil-DNA glycosylase [Acanthamoeba polyphaga mimivirus Kroon]
MSKKNVDLFSDSESDSSSDPPSIFSSDDEENVDNSITIDNKNTKSDEADIKYIDEDESSDSESESKSKKSKKSKNSEKSKNSVAKKKQNPLVGNRIITEYILIDANNYHFKTWSECFPDRKVNLKLLLFRPEWFEFFEYVENKTYFPRLENKLSSYLEKNQKIVPYPELLFNTMNVLPPSKIKVVILGQDPYPGSCVSGVPYAMGCSFSVPLNCPVPKSLVNIYKNLIKFNHMRKAPTHGCLASWILQGTFMINSAFTTDLGKSGVHARTWELFTADLIDYLNDNYDDLVFLAWGAHAQKLCQRVDPKKHYIITSSHPSPYSVSNTMTGMSYGPNPKNVTYPSFNSVDHFGKINEHLKSRNKKPIFWDL